MDAFYALAVLACPIGMGLMMWFMMRGSGRRGGTPADQSQMTGYAGFGDTDPQEREVNALRKEVDTLRARLDDQPRTSAGKHTR